MGITGKFAVSHDTLARSIFTDEFLEKNPALEFLRSELEQCRVNYNEEVKKKGCSCRVDSSWAAPCMTRVLDTLEQANKNNHDMVRQFVRFISRKPPDIDIDGLGVNIAYGDKTYTIMIDNTAPKAAAT